MRRLLIRWLTHPSRIPRTPRWALALVLAAMSVTGLAAQAPGQAGFPSNGPGGRSTSTANPPNKSPDPREQATRPRHFPPPRPWRPTGSTSTRSTAPRATD